MQAEPHPQHNPQQPTHHAEMAVSRVVQWEYRVVHINVDSGAPPQPPNPQVASEHLHGALSPNFLAREFPDHYGQQSEASRKNRHPAEQLQVFLNLLGKEGWDLTTTSQVGPLLMFFFKRPLRPAPKRIAPAQAEPASATAPRNDSDSKTV